jgi:hypothetical protein
VRRIAWPRAVAATVVAYLVIVSVLTLLFGNPLAERLLFGADAGQSPKALSVWLEQEPLPAVTPFWSDLGALDGRGLAVQGMLLIWCASLVLVYAWGWAERTMSPVRRGLTFGVAMWAVVFVFLEAWIPFNLLGEPVHLVAVELVLELIAMLAGGVAIALVYRTDAAGAGSPGDR